MDQVPIRNRWKSANTSLNLMHLYDLGAVTQGGYAYSQDIVKENELPMLDLGIGGFTRKILLYYGVLRSDIIIFLLVFAVKDPLKWHEANLRMNEDHYTTLIPFNACSIAYIQVAHTSTQIISCWSLGKYKALPPPLPCRTNGARGCGTML